jgi:hypothetical protein
MRPAPRVHLPRESGPIVSSRRVGLATGARVDSQADCCECAGCECAGGPSLPDEIITYVLTLTEQLSTVLSARIASSILLDPAAAAVDALVAEDGELPAVAWWRFPFAVRLVVRLTRREPPCPGRYLDNILLRTLPAAPAHLEELEIQAVAAGGTPHWSLKQGALLAQAVLASRCAAGLRVLHVGQRISLTAAEALLRGMHALQEVDLSLSAAFGEQQHGRKRQLSPAEQEEEEASAAAAAAAAAVAQQPQQLTRPDSCWQPSADLSGLEALTLRCNGAVQLDVACLAGAARLVRIVIWDCPRLHSWNAVGIHACPGITLRAHCRTGA